MILSHLFLVLISLFLFIYGFTICTLRQRKFIFSLLLFFSGVFYLIYSIFYFVSYYFTGRGIDNSVIYHVRYGLHGAGFGEYSELILGAISLLILGVAVISFLLLNDRKTTQSRRIAISAVVAMGVAGCIHPASIDIYKLTRQENEHNFWRYYRPPHVVSVDENPMNLVMIYGESLERSYFDQDVFPGIITRLRDLERSSISFTGIGKFPNTGWTIAGMVANQCGLPLVALSHGNSMAGMDSFLQGAKCLGDLLEEQGYNLSYYGGASLEFAGKGSFYKTHGFQTVKGRGELLPKLPDESYVTSWGLYDDSLFELASEEFERLSATSQPFGLVVLTLDTHGTEHYSKSCEDILETKTTFKNLVCTDYLIGEFIARIQESSASENTIIVVASDHMSMRRTKRLKMTDSKNLFMIIDPRQKEGRKISRIGSPLDLGPTILHSLGIEADIGLGRNLFNEDPSLVEQIDKIGMTVKGWNDEILKFWSFPKVKSQISINEQTGDIRIDDRVFKVPILIQFDNNLQTKIRFQFHRSDPRDITLIEHVQNFKPNEPFILVDECEALSNWWEPVFKNGLCLVKGKTGDDNIENKKIKGETIIDAKELTKIAQLRLN